MCNSISQDLKWEFQIDSIVNKAQQRKYFLSYQIGSQKSAANNLDCWENFQYTPSHSPRTVHIQSE